MVGEILRQLNVGEKLSSGEVVLTASGRRTTPFPKVSLGTNRMTQNTLRRVDQWLMENAVEEARARSDDFAQLQFELGRARPSPADKDCAEEYLFGR